MCNVSYLQDLRNRSSETKCNMLVPSHSKCCEQANHMTSCDNFVTQRKLAGNLGLVVSGADVGADVSGLQTYSAKELDIDLSASSHVKVSLLQRSLNSQQPVPPANCRPVGCNQAYCPAAPRPPCSLQQLVQVSALCHTMQSFWGLRASTGRQQSS